MVSSCSPALTPVDLLPATPAATLETVSTTTSESLSSTEKDSGSLTYSVYRGNSSYKGVSKESVDALIEKIKALVDRSSVEFFEREELAGRKLLVLPGGECSKWDELLPPLLLQHTFEWFKKGGRLFATCAGAYYCSTQSEYGASRAKPRVLDIFPGTCRGPRYTNPIIAVKIKWKSTGESGYIAMVGGGTFYPSSSLTSSSNAIRSYKTLATYEDSPNEEAIAIVECCSEKGIGILSGPHLELGRENLTTLKLSLPTMAAEIELAQELLDKSVTFRNQCLRDIFSRLSK